MASISVAKYTSATSYTVTISGLTTGQKYHLFIEDLTSSGGSNGWYCRYTQTATSTSYTYTGSTSSTYSQYDRRVRLYCTGTTATSHSTGTLYSTSELPSSNVTGAYTATIEAWGGSSSYTTNPIYFRTGTGVSSYKMQYANATTTGLTDSITGRNSSTTLYVRDSTNASLIGLDYESGYGGSFQFVEYTDSTFSTVKKYFTEGDAYVYSSGTRYIKLFASESTVTAYIKLGAGISSAMIYVDDVAKSDVRDSAYHAITVSSNSRVEVRSIGLTSGYGRPYTFRFYSSSTATTPSSYSESLDTDTPGYTYTSSRVYAEIVATKSTIDLFYWDSASTDSLLITAGQPISNLTAARWNKLKAKIAELATAEGGSYNYSEVAKGDTIYATEFNAVRTAIMNRSGYGTLPSAQSSGNAVKASLFEGSGSLKTALNAAITNYNNS